MERFVYRLAAHHRIADVEEWKKRTTLRQIVKWLGYWKVEPFGDDWGRSARQTMFLAAALGAKVPDDFLEKFLPNYDPNRVMSDDEINAEMTKFARRIQQS
jgi:hypothetical protein